LSETKILCLRLRYFVWDKDTLSETYKLLFPLQFYSIYSPLSRILFSSAINFFSCSRLFNSIAIHLITLALLPLLLKSLLLSTACLSSAPIYDACSNPHPLLILIAALTLSEFTMIKGYTLCSKVQEDKEGNSIGSRETLELRNWV